MLFSIFLGGDNSEMLIQELFNEYMVMTDLSGDPYGFLTRATLERT